MQVYEYFISHHLAKAFESLFGTVTCLPGCFSMYRIRSATKNIPVLVSPAILSDYSENTVDTLHKKNLLHLGEDRYLTTLLLKHFPQMRTKFTGEAVCETVAPDRWSVLLSQRRRWINSTVHNLLELFMLEQLCGFCCFSMRFVVILDLFATFVQPATILYIGYLIYAVVASREQFPLLSLILIGAIYGLQVIIFIAKREWQHIAWMFIYIAATPIISFYIPCYAFWHFDDFSWGNTRVVVGEGKKTVYVADSEPFDPNSIPLKRWRDFEENDLWENESMASGSTRKSKSRAAGSEYSFGMQPEYNLRTSIGSKPGELDPRMSMVSMGSRAPDVDPRMSMVSMGSRIPESRSSYSGSVTGGPPVSIPDDILYMEVRKALVGADLMTLTKKQIREGISAKLGIDLRSKKETINRMIDEILSQQP
jgi:chitin synthase